MVSPGQEAVGQEHRNVDSDNEGVCDAFWSRFLARSELEEQTDQRGGISLES
jgi:hypothetical protein